MHCAVERTQLHLRALQLGSRASITVWGAGAVSHSPPLSPPNAVAPFFNTTRTHLHAALTAGSYVKHPGRLWSLGHLFTLVTSVLRLSGSQAQCSACPVWDSQASGISHPVPALSPCSCLSVLHSSTHCRHAPIPSVFLLEHSLIPALTAPDLQTCPRRPAHLSTFPSTGSRPSGFFPSTGAFHGGV